MRAPEISVHVPVLAGCTTTESAFYLRGDPGQFALVWADVKRRLTRFLAVDEVRVAGIIDAYRSVYRHDSPGDILMLISSDYTYIRNTYRTAALQSSSARVPVYTYQFDRKAPVEGGRWSSPHTSEVPFISGTMAAAAAHVGDGLDLAPMTRRMMAAWAAFARHGHPENPMLPD